VASIDIVTINLMTTATIGNVHKITNGDRVDHLADGNYGCTAIGDNGSPLAAKMSPKLALMAIMAQMVKITI
jgi:hypothetical protein